MKNPITQLLTHGDRQLVRKLEKTADHINSLKEHYQQYTDAEILAETDMLKQNIENGTDPDTLLPLAFANAREASQRTLGMFPYKVQLMGGIALNQGNIAELSTGSGKTLTAVAPSYLNALAGKGVHVVTVNDYLAESQAQQMSRVYRALGMTTGIMKANQTPPERKKQYNCDITYGTNNEFGFDYLKDNMTYTLEERVQRDHHFVIIDEVDSILIDEARTPLIISGPAEGQPSHWYSYMAHAVRNMREGEHYITDHKKRTIEPLDPAFDYIEDQLGMTTELFNTDTAYLVHYLTNAIKAKSLFTHGKDYIVTPSGEVAIIDESTGRILEGRRYSDGLHQALEAKENVEIQPENLTMATVTLQNYFKMYTKMSGMTGTAETEAAEFASTYGMQIAVIPNHKPKQRIDQNDLIYKNEKAKLTAVIKDVTERHATGQPVLIGTTSVQKSEELSKLLSHVGLPHNVLNAKYHEQEAAIIAKAGIPGAITVATNMAGRGTDIILGGNPEHAATQIMKQLGATPEGNQKQYDQLWKKTLETEKAKTNELAVKVKELGGLYVIGTERHESRRIDNQLRGRAGRQGDPGESRFYLALTDTLMQHFNPTATSRLMANAPEDTALEHKLVTSAINRAQANIENQNTEQRKNTLKYDDVLNHQRKAFYTERNNILTNTTNTTEDIHNWTKQLITKLTQTHAPKNETWTEQNLENLWKDLTNTIYTPSYTPTTLINHYQGNINRITQENLIQELTEDAKLQYQHTQNELGETHLQAHQKHTILTAMNTHWPKHLVELDTLKEGVGLRAIAQKNPLTEYQTESYHLYLDTLDLIKAETLRNIYPKLPYRDKTTETQ